MHTFDLPLALTHPPRQHLAGTGDNGVVDLLVGDIYGKPRMRSDRSLINTLVHQLAFAWTLLT